MRLFQNSEHVMLLCLFALVCFAMPFDASAGTTMSQVLCNGYNWVTSNAGKGVATLAVLTLGFMALLGRINWGLAIMACVGIAIIFSAPTIVNAVSSDGTGC